MILHQLMLKAKTLCYLPLKIFYPKILLILSLTIFFTISKGECCQILTPFSVLLLKEEKV